MESLIMNLDDIKKLKLNKKPNSTKLINKDLPKHKPGEKFLKGPIPWTWISEAARQPGRSLHVALALWFLAGINKNSTVPLTNTVLKPLGLDRFAKGRSIKRLERAGLISVNRHAGRNPLVTILDVE
jgi:hypothetical protein